MAYDRPGIEQNEISLVCIHMEILVQGASTGYNCCLVQQQCGATCCCLGLYNLWRTTSDILPSMFGNLHKNTTVSI